MIAEATANPRLPAALTHATATYRLQLRDGVDFAEAERWLPYLAGLGVSHLYLSPIFTAQSGSTHGYDVTRPDQIDPALGGRAGFERLARAAAGQGIGVILDIVPNHTAFGFENPWLRDVLRHGQASRYAGHFDIDWSRPLLLPMLGAPLETVLEDEAPEIAAEADGPVLRLAGLSVPLAPQGGPGDVPPVGPLSADTLRDLLARQPWRLAHWEMERDAITHRRFFNVTSLIGMRVEDRAVFEDMHALIFDLVGAGLVQGLRVDHIDGLADPAAYLERLTTRLPGCPVWVEKILSGDEALDPDWPVAGTTGYEAGRAIAGLLADPAGVARLTELWRRETGDEGSFHDALIAAKNEVIRRDLSAELVQLGHLAQEVVTAMPHLEAGPEALREAVLALLLAVPRYRTYFAAGPARAEDLALWSQVMDDAAAGLRSDRVLRALGAAMAAGDSAQACRLACRFQQVSGALIAKSLEDTAGFRHTPYLAANEVGAEPDAPCLSTEAFAALCAERLALWPAALTLTSSHDTKRSEDARMRLVALGHLPEEFFALYRGLRARPEAEGIDRATLWYLAQSAVAIWEDGRGDLADRLAGHMEKAMREAKQVTFWPYPDAAAEAPVLACARALIADWAEEPPVALLRIAALGETLSLAQLALKLAMPGLPDLYRGTELGAFGLTDPDNRLPVALAALEGPKQGLARAKSRLLGQMMALRATQPATFLTGAFALTDDGPGRWTLRRGAGLGAIEIAIDLAHPLDEAITLRAPQTAMA
ncbi:malto-oligosyltrehalose synthase [Frigidibacter sp. MR17.14]|uniref:malto-oligosyltrehalose synthase n=1 Tax=Frigidibacter sp. MR17.14 TaxID=3126509 RepID=UPI003012CBEC